MSKRLIRGPRELRTIGPFALTALVVAGTLDCRSSDRAGCLTSGDPACVPPTPCARLVYEPCAGGMARVYRLTDPAQRPAGLHALAAVGDFVIENDQLTAVIDAPADALPAESRGLLRRHSHHLAPSGGNLLDLAPRGGADHLNQVYQVTGIVPRDAVTYTRADVVSEGNGAAVVVRGHLDGDARVEVVTRYELRACEPGLRVRTELYNGGRTVWSEYLADGFFWGDRGVTPFIPTRGTGFRVPALDLLEIEASSRQVPWMAAQSHAVENTSYSVVACEQPALYGLQSSTLSAVGRAPTVVPPGDGITYERVIFAARGPGLSGAQSLADDARARMFSEPVARVAGRVQLPDGAPLGGDERQVSLLVYEPGPPAAPDDPAQIVPRSEVVPAADGTYQLSLPTGRRYRARVHRLGRPMNRAGTTQPLAVDFDVPAGAQGPVAVEAITVPAAPRMSVTVTDATSGMPVDAEVVLVPTGATRAADVDGSVYGYFQTGACAPYLGPPHGASPACNRAIARGGRTEFALPAGAYWVYARGGIAQTLARSSAPVVAADGATVAVALSLGRLDGVLPAGALSGDFHVHSGRSFDSSFPEDDRVMSFVVAGIDVLAATDHDVCTSYGDTIAQLGVGDRVRVMPGVEMTPLIPFSLPPGASLPRTLGHMQAWPLRRDPALARDGAPWEELQEPGQVLDLMRPEVGEHGVLQLNHPLADSKLGRDEGFVSAIGFLARQPIPSADDGTSNGLLVRRPGGPTGHRNIDYDAQEVFTGAPLWRNLQARAFWFAVLNQGFRRAGTANSDSHSLEVEPMGFPRNVVLGVGPLAAFAPDAFNDAVRDGRMVGTNGPVIEATITDAAGVARGPSLTPFAPAASGALTISVRAAPWVPVNEVRIIVNGEVAQTIPAAQIAVPADPFGTAGIVRWTGTVPLASLRALVGHDGWIVVEAGLALPATLDDEPAGGDGFIDAVDANGDGRVEHEERDIPLPAESDPRFHIHVLSPGTWPMAFTNPFFVNIDGGEWTPPGLVRQ